MLFLIYFKERNFFVITHNLLSLSLHLKQWQSVNIIAPLGVSYLSLMLISYILDVAWGTVSAQKNPLKFLCYVIYFPILTSGPITRYSEIENQIFAVRDFNYDRFCFGIQRIAWGFFKKLVIADDGVAFYTDDYGAYNLKNLNRVVTVDLETFALSESPVDSDIDFDYHYSNGSGYIRAGVSGGSIWMDATGSLYNAGTKAVISSFIYSSDSDENGTSVGDSLVLQVAIPTPTN